LNTRLWCDGGVWTPTNLAGKRPARPIQAVELTVKGQEGLMLDVQTGDAQDRGRAGRHESGPNRHNEWVSRTPAARPQNSGL
jgi:hypothetical protein